MQEATRVGIVLSAALCILTARGVGAADETLPVIDSPEKAVSAQKTAAEKLGKPVEWRNSMDMTFRLIPAGEFVMGAKDGRAGETPHRVRITQPFYMGAMEVTRAQWEAVTEKQRSTYFPGPDMPINFITWNDAQEFVGKLNKKEKVSYRLPTEAEWEYAARAGSVQVDLDKSAWYDLNSQNVLHPGGQKASNAFGLFDTLGNVWEWCDDFYDANYYAVSPVDDPKGPVKSTYRYRVLRGGSIYFGPAACCPTARNYYQESRSDKHIGFRVVLPATAVSQPQAK